MEEVKQNRRNTPPAATTTTATARTSSKALLVPTSSSIPSAILTPSHHVPTSTGRQHLGSIAYFLRTLYLFTLSDHLTFIVPQAMFGILGALSGPALTRNAAASTMQVLLRVPAVFFWTWLHTLIFTMHNQSSPEAVMEDKMNKPFRPIAAGRITIGQTKALLWALIPLTAIMAACLGGVAETIFLLVGNFMYNEGRGSDKSVLVRNWSIATAFALYGAGALEVACGGFALGAEGVTWTLAIATVIMTTMQIQDLKDQPGDAQRGRRTIPLVFGDGPARWSIIVPVIFWTTAAVVYWRTPLICTLPSMVLGLVVCMRLAALRDTHSDKTTWKLWSVWLLSLYHLPLVYALGS